MKQNTLFGYIFFYDTAMAFPFYRHLGCCKNFALVNNEGLIIF